MAGKIKVIFMRSITNENYSGVDISGGCLSMIQWAQEGQGLYKLNLC